MSEKPIMRGSLFAFIETVQTMLAFSRTIRRTVTIAIWGFFIVGWVNLSQSNCSAQDNANTRVWSDNSGTFSVEAELLSYSATDVKLKKLNGVPISVPINRLSGFDAKFLEKLKLTQNTKQLANVGPALKPGVQAPVQIRNQVPVQRVKSSPASNPIKLIAPTHNPRLAVPNSNRLVISPNGHVPNRPAAQLPATANQFTFPSSKNDTVLNGQFDSTGSFSATPNSNLFQALNGNNNRISNSEQPGESGAKSSTSLTNGSGGSGMRTKAIKANVKMSILDRPIAKPLPGNFELANADVGSTANTRNNDTGMNLKPNVLRASSSLPTDQHSELANRIANSQNRDTVRSSLSHLTKNWPTQASPQLIAAIRQATTTNDARSRKLAVDLLANFDSQQSLPWILKAIDDDSFGVRWAAYEWLEQLQDVRAIEPLCEKMATEGGNQAAHTLASFGSAAEPYALQLLGNESDEVKLTVCSLLSKIGSQASLGPLTNLSSQSEKIKLRMQASNAITSIKKRIDQ